MLNLIREREMIMDGDNSLNSLYWLVGAENEQEEDEQYDWEEEEAKPEEERMYKSPPCDSPSYPLDPDSPVWWRRPEHQLIAVSTTGGCGWGDRYLMARQVEDGWEYAIVHWWNSNPSDYHVLGSIVKNGEIVYRNDREIFNPD